MRPHIDEDLDRMKHIYHGIDGVLVRYHQSLITIGTTTELEPVQSGGASVGRCTSGLYRYIKRRLLSSTGSVIWDLTCQRELAHPAAQVSSYAYRCAMNGKRMEWMCSMDGPFRYDKLGRLPSYLKSAHSSLLSMAASSFIESG